MKEYTIHGTELTAFHVGDPTQVLKGVEEPFPTVDEIVMISCAGPVIWAKFFAEVQSLSPTENGMTVTTLMRRDIDLSIVQYDALRMIGVVYLQGKRFAAGSEFSVGDVVIARREGLDTVMQKAVVTAFDWIEGGCTASLTLRKL